MKTIDVRSAAILSAVLVTSVGLSSVAAAGPSDPISREEIINRADQGLGYGYWWSHARWKTDQTKQGFCTVTGTNACKDSHCTYTGFDDQGNQVSCPMGPTNTGPNCYGADCSGYTFKSWNLGSKKDVSVDEHGPYVAASFKSGAAQCKKISRRELLPGDAMASNGHVVIFDSFGADGQSVWVREAKQCISGVVHDPGPFSNYQACRRNNLLPSPTCDPNACNKHGRMSGETCICDQGYWGPSCDRCAPGYDGYPTCVSLFDTCTVVQDIQCGQTIHGTTTAGASKMTHYGPFCGNWVEDGKEVVYRFQPKVNGKAVLSLSNIEDGKDVDLMLLRGACDALSCQEYGDESTSLFSISNNDVFYVSVDSFAGGEGSFDLTATCTPGTGGPWIGDSCDKGCSFVDPANEENQGYCYNKKGSNFCSLSCTDFCPDQPDNAPTFCIRDPNMTAAVGMCVPKADSLLNHCCADLPGTELKELSHFSWPGTAWVCAPKP